MDEHDFAWREGRWRFRVRPLSLACCALEVDDARPADADLPGARARVADPPAPAPDVVHVLVVAGTVTEALVPAVQAAYAQLPEPRRVISYGACANSGGPYWDSYSVRNGVHRLVPVDVVVPGCPPRPEALADGLRVLAARLDAEPAAGPGRT